MNRLIIRCDGGRIQTRNGLRNIASGHLMRMLKIATHWKALGETVVLVTHQYNRGTEPYLDRYREIGCPIQFTQGAFCDEDVEELISIAQSQNGHLVYLDGCHFQSPYQRLIHEQGIRLIVQDDSGMAAPYFADIIVGSHVHAPDIKYEVLPSTRLLLGTEFALIGESFLKIKTTQGVPSRATRLLVTLGGDDIGRDTEKCLKGLLILPQGKKVNEWLRMLQVTVIVGAQNSFTSEVESLANELLSRRLCTTRILQDVRNMAQIMSESDIAFSAAGGTLLELLYLGIPVAVKATHPFHVQIAQKLAAEKACVWVDDPGVSEDNLKQEEGIGRTLFALAEDPIKRRVLSTSGKRLVDGKGVERVCRSIASLST